jgi:hypothetical protein
MKKMVKQQFASPGLFGTWPMIDFCRGYAYIVFVKNLLGEARADAHLEIKKIIDKQILSLSVISSRLIVNSYMYEHKKQPVAPLNTFCQRVLKNILIALIIAICLAIGVAGYHTQICS